MNDLNPIKPQPLPLNSPGMDEALKAIEAAMNNPSTTNAVTVRPDGANTKLMASPSTGPNPVVIKASPSQPLEVRLSDLPLAPTAEALDDLSGTLDTIHEISNISPLVALDHNLALMTNLNMKMLKNLAPAGLAATEAINTPEPNGKGRDLQKSQGRIIASICRLQESNAKLMAARIKVHDEIERRMGPK